MVQNINEIQNQNNTQAIQTGLTAYELQRLTEQINKLNQPQALKQETLSRILDKSVVDRGTAIVSNAVAAFAQSTIGKVFNENVKVRSKDNKELSEADYLQGSDEAAQDSVTIASKGKTTSLEKQMEILRGQKENAQKTQVDLDSETKALMKEYTELYGRMVTTQSGAASQEIEKLEKKLKDKGYTSDQLYQLKLTVKTSIREAVVNQIKDAYLKRTLSLDMVVEYGSADIGLNKLLGEILESQELGGKDFGGYKTDLQGSVNYATDEVSREVRLALKDLLNQKMTERLVSSDVNPQKVRKELQDLLKIGGRVGFDPSEYMKSWYKDKINQGLFVFQRPDMPIALSNQLKDQSKKEDEEPETETEDSSETEDYLVNRLRALYIRSAIKGDWRTSLDTSFKIIKTKNKMIKLGIYSNDVNDKVKKEAQLVAGTKIMQMLQEACLERGTLYKLAGPAYQLNDIKITGLLKNAEKLGMDISEYEFNLIKDRANQTVFEVGKRELHLTNLALAVEDRPALRTKKQKLILLLQRLKDESNLPDEIGLSQNELVDVDRVKVEK